MLLANSRIRRYWDLEYSDCAALLDSARSRKAGKPIKYATRLFERKNGVFALRHHETDIIRWLPNGHIRIDCDGWRSVTTKARLNEFVPFGFFHQENGIWYYEKGGGRYLYKDGMELDANGDYINAPDDSVVKERERLKRKVDRMVSKYIKGFLADLASGNFREPDGGDCWFCSMFETENPMECHTDHLLSHFEEQYYVPSLLYRAVIEQGYAQPGMILWHIKRGSEKGERSDFAYRALARYFRQRKERLVDALAG